MSSKELKQEIQKVIESVPENALEDVLAYLQQVVAASGENLKDSRHLRAILLEDRELLEKLAQ